MTEVMKDYGADTDLFSPEELALMNGSDGLSGFAPVKPAQEQLEEQVRTMAVLVAEGCERERQLRNAMKRLELAAASADDFTGIQAQVASLAQMLMTSAERERALQQRLNAISAMVAGGYKLS
jgi:hypothetical protein